MFSLPLAGHSDQQHLQMSMDEDDALLQYAIQQSLVEAGTEQDQVDIWEALQAEHRPAPRVPGWVLQEWWWGGEIGFVVLGL